ncbi:MAG: nitroreductase/quinone reductase family protein [Dehalococcoidia bacterium]
MDAQVKRALERDRVIDITTIGRKTGQQRRIEIWFHNVDGKLFISGSPGRRDWYANLVAEPNFTFHLKDSVRADLPAKATPIRDPNQRREIFSGIFKKPGGERDLEAWLQGSPLVEVELRGL